MRLTRSHVIGLALAGAGVSAMVAGHRLRSSRAAAPAAAVTAVTEVTEVDGDELAVLSITATPRDLPMGGSATLTADVVRGQDRTGPLRFHWEVGRGRIEGGGDAQARWIAGGKAGSTKVQLTVSDDDGEATAELAVGIYLPAQRPLPARAVADVPDGDHGEAARAAMRAKLDALRAARATTPRGPELNALLEELGQLLLDLDEYEDALPVYVELRGEVLRAQGSWKDYSDRYGVAAYYMGLDDQAREAFEAAENHASPMSRYYLADLYEREGRTDDAIAGYLRAREGNVWYGEPVYRAGVLMLQRGDSSRSVAELLVAASPRLGRERIMDRLQQDPEMAGLLTALRDNGAIEQLEDSRPYGMTIDGRMFDPEDGPPPPPR